MCSHHCTRYWGKKEGNKVTKLSLTVTMYRALSHMLISFKRLREIVWHALGHLPADWQSQNLNPRLLLILYSFHYSTDKCYNPWLWKICSIGAKIGHKHLELRVWDVLWLSSEEGFTNKITPLKFKKGRVCERRIIKNSFLGNWDCSEKQ